MNAIVQWYCLVLCVEAPFMLPSTTSRVLVDKDAWKGYVALEIPHKLISKCIYYIKHFFLIEKSNP